MRKSLNDTKPEDNDVDTTDLEILASSPIESELYLNLELGSAFRRMSMRRAET